MRCCLALEEADELERLVRLPTDEVRILKTHGYAALGGLAARPFIFQVDDDADGISQPDADDVLDRVGHGRGEQVCAPLFRQVAHDALNVTPVVGRAEQAVGLVEHQHVEVAYADRVHAARGEEERRQPTRRAHEDVGSLREERLVRRNRAARY